MVTLQNLDRYVFKNNGPFDPEHYIAWGRPITKLEETKLVAMIFSDDTALEEISTPNGTLKFLSAIGITDDEYQVAASGGGAKLLAQLVEGNPLAVVDIKRGSLLKL